jgi:hypothetical protein
MIKGFYTTEGKTHVDAVSQTVVEVKIGSRFYDNNSCVQIFVDPLKGYMKITPEAWDELAKRYTFRIWHDKEPFEKNRYLEITGIID